MADDSRGATATAQPVRRTARRQPGAGADGQPRRVRLGTGPINADAAGPNDDALDRPQQRAGDGRRPLRPAEDDPSQAWRFGGPLVTTEWDAYDHDMCRDTVKEYVAGLAAVEAGELVPATLDGVTDEALAALAAELDARFGPSPPWEEVPNSMSCPGAEASYLQNFVAEHMREVLPEWVRAAQKQLGKLQMEYSKAQLMEKLRLDDEWSDAYGERDDAPNMFAWVRSKMTEFPPEPQHPALAKLVDEVGVRATHIGRQQLRAEREAALAAEGAGGSGSSAASGEPSDHEEEKA